MDILLSKTIQKANKALLMSKQEKLRIYQEICDKMTTLSAMSTDLINPKKERKNISADKIMAGILTVISDGDKDVKKYYSDMINALVLKETTPGADLELTKKYVLTIVITSWINIHSDYCRKAIEQGKTDKKN